MDQVGPGGETIIDYTIYDAIRAGFGKIVFVIRKQMQEAFADAILNHVSSHIEVACAFQELDMLPAGRDVPSGREKPWGTAHAVWVASSEVDTPFAIVNADDFYGRDSLLAIANHLKSINPGELAGCLVGFKLENTLSDFGTVSRGVCEVREGNLMQIEERTHIARDGDRIYFEQAGSSYSLPGDTQVSMNLMGFTPSVFQVIEEGLSSFLEEKGGELKSEYYIPDVLKALIQKEISVPVLPTTSKWFGVTYQEDKAEVQKRIVELVKSGEYPTKLWE